MPSLRSARKKLARHSVHISVQFIDTYIGSGVFAEEDIEKGSFVCFYEGLLISGKEGLKRFSKQPENEGSFLFFFSHKGQEHCIDATHSQGFGRMMNDSSKPNCKVVVEQKEELKLAIYTIKDIKKSQELRFDYNDKTVYWRKKDAIKQNLYQAPDADHSDTSNVLEENQEIIEFDEGDQKEIREIVEGNREETIELGDENQLETSEVVEGNRVETGEKIDENQIDTRETIEPVSQNETSEVCTVYLIGVGEVFVKNQESHEEADGNQKETYEVIKKNQNETCKVVQGDQLNTSEVVEGNQLDTSEIHEGNQETVDLDEGNLKESSEAVGNQRETSEMVDRSQLLTIIKTMATKFTRIMGFMFYRAFY